MLVTVKVVPKSRNISVSREKDCLKVRLTRPAHDGEANKQLIEVLAAHFDIQKYRIRLVRGTASRIKTVEILDG